MTGGLLSPTHLAFILLIALLVLGPKRLPDVARAVGRGVREFRETIEGPTGAARSLLHGEPSTAAEPPPVAPVEAHQQAVQPNAAPTPAAEPPPAAPVEAHQQAVQPNAAAQPEPPKPGSLPPA